MLPTKHTLLIVEVRSARPGPKTQDSMDPNAWIVADTVPGSPFWTVRAVGESFAVAGDLLDRLRGDADRSGAGGRIWMLAQRQMPLVLQDHIQRMPD